MSWGLIIESEENWTLISKIQQFIGKDKIFFSFVAVLSLVLVGLIVALAIASSNVGTAIEKKNVQYQKYSKLNIKMLDENSKALIKTVNQNFSGSQIGRVVEKNSTYTLIVNSKKVDKNTVTYYANSPSVTVVLFENYNTKILNILPKKLIVSGSMLRTKKISSIINISTNKAKMKSELKSTEFGQYLNFSFSGVKAGEIITLDINPILAEKLGLKTNVLEIIYNKAK